MKQISAGGYRRISKAEARRRYDAGETIRLVGCNIRPDNEFGMYADAQKDHYTEVSSDGFNTTVARSKKFDVVSFAFKNYNCMNKETGYYPAYYVKEN